MLTTFIQQLYNSLAVSGVYISVALGVTLIYGLTGLLNLSIAQLLTLGGFLTYSLTAAGLPFWLALVVAALAVGAFSEAIDLALLRRTADTPINGLVVTLGLVVALQAAFVLIWGTGLVRVDPPVAGTWQIGDLTIDRPRAVLIGVTALACAALFLFLEKTRIGRGLKALASDRTTATLMGIPVGPYISASFFAGSALAGLAGGLFATAYPFDAYSGFKIVLTAFAIAIVGGLGSVKGTVVAGFLFALAQTLAAAYISQPWSEAYGLLATLVILVVRPDGIFRSGAAPVGGTFTLRFRARAGALVYTAAARRRHQVVTAGAVAIVAAVLLLVPSLLGTSRDLSVATNMVIVAIAAYAFWFAVRGAGIFSIAPAAFMGIGAYVSAYLSVQHGISFPLQVGLSVVGGAIGAVLLGAVAFRSRGSAFVIFTLVAAETLVLVAQNWSSVTNGQLGLSVVGYPQIGAWEASTGERMYYLALGALVLGGLVLALHQRSRAAWRGRAVRENPELAASLGINVLREQLVVFALSGAVSALAGSVAFYYLRFVEPGTFNVLLSVNIILIVILGGISDWVGPLVGAAIFVFAPEVLDLGPDWTQLAYGTALIGMIIVASDGVAGATRRLVAWVGERLRSPRQVEPDPGPPAPTVPSAAPRAPAGLTGGRDQ